MSIRDWWEVARDTIIAVFLILGICALVFGAIFFGVYIFSLAEPTSTCILLESK